MSLRDDLIREEGRVGHVYKDSLGLWTIGVGHLVDESKGAGLPDPIIDALLDYDITHARTQLETELPWVKSRSQSTQDALCQMVFQIGLHGLLGFKSMLACLQAGDYAGAQAHGLDSAWAQQTPERAKRVTDMFVP